MLKASLRAPLSNLVRRRLKRCGLHNVFEMTFEKRIEDQTLKLQNICLAYPELIPSVCHERHYQGFIGLKVVLLFLQSCSIHADVMGTLIAEGTFADLMKTIKSGLINSAILLRRGYYAVIMMASASSFLLSEISIKTKTFVVMQYFFQIIHDPSTIQRHGRSHLQERIGTEALIHQTPQCHTDEAGASFDFVENAE